MNKFYSAIVTLFFLLIALAHPSFADDDFQELESKYQQAISSGDKAEQGESALKLGISYLHSKRRNSDGIAKLKEAIKIAQEIGNSDLEARAREAFGDHFGSFGKKFHKDAIQAYKLAAGLYQNNGEENTYLRILIKAGKLNYSNNIEASAQKNLEAALRVANSLGDNKAIESIHVMLVEVYSELDLAEKRIASYETLIDIYSSRNDTELEKEALEMVMIAYYQASDYEKLIPTYKRLAELSMKLGNMDIVVDYYDEIADAYYEIDDTLSAQEYEQKILDLTTPLPDDLEDTETESEDILEEQIASKSVDHKVVQQQADNLKDSVKSIQAVTNTIQEEIEQTKNQLAHTNNQNERKELLRKLEELNNRLNSENEKIAQYEKNIKALKLAAEQSKKKELYFTIALGVGAIALVVFVFALFAQMRAKKKLSLQNEEILQQKEEIEAQQEEIVAKSEQVEEERKKSDELLLNILPQAVANELKATNKYQPRHYDTVSVIFTDFKGFTQIAESMSPEDLVEELDYCFRGFDHIIAKHNIEKIKTIGDAYMCAGGIPLPNNTNPVDAVKAALEMVEFIEERKQEREARGLLAFQLRLGINTGPIVAGVVGSTKFAYDIWGDAVNLAARMESSGGVGKVNISESTYDLVKDKFICEYRGKISAKNKGEIDMYFVEGRI